MFYNVFFSFFFLKKILFLLIPLFIKAMHELLLPDYNMDESTNGKTTLSAIVRSASSDMYYHYYYFFRKVVNSNCMCFKVGFIDRRTVGRKS